MPDWLLALSFVVVAVLAYGLGRMHEMLREIKKQLDEVQTDPCVRDEYGLVIEPGDDPLS
jgi:cbb3-type cytochrome oxidase subunit 1